MDYSHTPAYSPQMASSYNTQQIQDYPDTRMPQHYVRRTGFSNRSNLTLHHHFDYLLFTCYLVHEQYVL